MHLINVTDLDLYCESIRCFTSKNKRRSSYQKISKRIIKKIIEQASKSPSGGNLQPWKAFILSGEPLKKLITDVEKELTIS